MRSAGRLALAIVLLLLGTMLLPRPAARLLAPDARAQLPEETPTIPDILSTPSLPSPTDDDDGKGGGGKDDDGKGGGGKDGGGKDDGDDDDGPVDDVLGGGDDKDGRPNKGNGDKAAGSPKDGKKKKNDRKKDFKADPSYGGSYRPTGSFTTDKLVAIAAQLRSMGLTTEAIARRVYAPFIIGGPAAWTDTWGAPRYGPGPIVRTHEGQDVFCEFGDPVLAVEEGTVEFDNGGLGGLVARLFRPDGSYWYYAHLSDWNTKDFRSGDRVEVGDVIGYCGNTGNAISTPPHVHFGWYDAGGTRARNPMRALVTWLHIAERRAGVALTRAGGRRIENIEELTSARRFGDSLVPDVVEFTTSTESLLASGSSPASGTFGLAEAALAAALSDAVAGDGYEPDAAAFSEEGAGVTLDPESPIAEIFETDEHTHGESGD